MKKEYEPVNNNLVMQFDEYLKKLSPEKLFIVLDDMENDGIFPQGGDPIPDYILTCSCCRKMHNGRCIDEEYVAVYEHIGTLCNRQFREYYENNHNIIWGDEETKKDAV